VNGKLYIIGGYISGIRAVDSVYEYDPVVDRWTAKKPTPTARHAIEDRCGPSYF
jgi:N-acetylneuraminic acid mutarotase